MCYLMAVYGVGAEGSVLRGVGPWGAQSLGRGCGGALSLGVAWALCMRDGSTCDSTDSRCACGLAQVHATGLEIVPVSPLYVGSVITLFP